MRRQIEHEKQIAKARRNFRKISTMFVGMPLNKKEKKGSPDERKRVMKLSTTTISTIGGFGAPIQNNLRRNSVAINTNKTLAFVIPEMNV